MSLCPGSFLPDQGVLEQELVDVRRQVESVSPAVVEPTVTERVLVSLIIDHPAVRLSPQSQTGFG